MHRGRPFGGKSDFSSERKGKDLLPYEAERLGQPCPQHCPHGKGREPEPLGEPMNIDEVARLIGCSAWSVRQKFLHQGLPHFRMSDTGKLIFYGEQVIRWVLSQQQKKGGNS